MTRKVTKQEKTRRKTKNHENDKTQESQRNREVVEKQKNPTSNIRMTLGSETQRNTD